MDKNQLLSFLKSQNFPENIIKAFEKVDREKFIPEKHHSYAYHNTALPIGHGQTISQPYTIAYILTLLELKGNQEILEIGSGSGYVLALLSKLAPNSKITGIERIKSLAESSKQKLKNYKNIQIINADGTKPISKKSFDRIIVSASANEIPQNLLKQLKFGGIMIAPVKDKLTLIKKQSGQNKIIEHPGFVFVPLISDSQDTKNLKTLQK